MTALGKNPDGVLPVFALAKAALAYVLAANALVTPVFACVNAELA